MGGNAERPQHGRGAKGHGFAGFHPNLIPGCHWPWNPHSCCWAVVAIQGASLGSSPGQFWGSLGCFGHIFGGFHARRDGSRAVPWQGRDDVCSSFFSPGQSPSAMEDLLDVENKRMADSLASKVTRLKSLALDIDKDAEEQNRYLDGMDSDFLSVTGLLTGSVKRFSGMARSGRDNRRLLLAVSVALILIFFILYYLVSRAGS
ncbi:BET1-like protein [Cyanistes caeruleus]|nr:BET1-like protein [Cyanistes caeruleus]